jgi:hypothetical protein
VVPAIHDNPTIITSLYVTVEDPLWEVAIAPPCAAINRWMETFISSDLELLLHLLTTT